MENSTVRRGLVLLVLVTCSILALWFAVDRLGGDADQTPSATPTVSVTGTP